VALQARPAARELPFQHVTGGIEVSRLGGKLHLAGDLPPADSRITLELEELIQHHGDE